MLRNSKLLVVSVLLLSGCAADSMPEPYNHTVVLIDSSGSYQKRRGEALGRAVALLEDYGQRKLKRWDPGADRIAIVALDAVPEVLWEGGFREMQETPADVWTRRFEARTDYAHCTDVTAAFRVALSRFQADPRHVQKRLVVFSDLIDEPPTTSIRTCGTARFPSLPKDDFPWDGLSETAVSVFWLPPDQKLAWGREVAKRGLGEQVRLYTVAESSAAPLQAPPVPTLEVTAEEQAAQREKIGAGALSLAKGLGGVAAVSGLALGAITLGLRRGRRRAPVRSRTTAVTAVRRPSSRPSR